eukprot:gene39519-39779_t
MRRGGGKGETVVMHASRQGLSQKDIDELRAQGIDVEFVDRRDVGKNPDA